MSKNKHNSSSLDFSLLKRLLNFLLPYKGLLVAATGITIISSALGPIRPKLIQSAIDLVITPSVQGKAPLTSWTITEFTIALGALLLLHGLLQFSLTYIMQYVGQKVLHTIRVSVFEHIERLSMRFFDTSPVGRLVTRVTNDIEALNELFSSGVVLIFSDILVLMWIIIFMVMTSWKLTLYSIIVVPVLLIAASIFRRYVRIAYNKIRLEIAKINSFFNEYITGITTVQLFGQEQSQSSIFESINARHRDLQIQSIFYYAVFFPVVEFLSSLALAIVLWYTAGSILQGEMTLGVLIAFIQYAEMFFRPIRDLTEKYNTLQSAVTASERVFEILDTPVTEPLEQKTSTVPELQESIVFENVTFSYDGINDVIKNISFTIQKGQMVALVGATGSGKSTIMNLLCKFYDYEQGSITIDHRELKTLDSIAHRKRLAIVLQDIFLFSRTVFDNITMGREYSTETIQQRTSGLGMSFVENLPNGYNTNVKERGTTLSTGQKQMISYARAISGNPEIVILDEATANIDSETEQLIDSSLEKLLEGRTLLVIAHRLSTIQHADKIIVLHKGEIVEQGKHQELLALKGFYAKLHRLQFASR